MLLTYSILFSNLVQVGRAVRNSTASARVLALIQVLDVRVL